jgi:hypothetical protein
MLKSMALGPGLRLAGMLWSPSPFGIRVSHQTQEPPSEFPPATPGDAARRLVAHKFRSAISSQSSSSLR